MRITKKRLENRLRYLCKQLGLPCGHWAQGDNGEWTTQPNGLGLDHAACYGGWQLQQIDGKGGTGVTVIGPYRMSGKEMGAFLGGMGAVAYPRGLGGLRR